MKLDQSYLKIGRRVYWLLIISSLLLTQSFFTSCVSNKKYTLIQADDGGTRTDTVGQPTRTYTRTNYLIQPNDILQVNVRSADPDVARLFNLQDPSQGMRGGAGGGGMIFYMMGYPVDDSGHIELPIIGSLEVGGLNIHEAKNKIYSEVEQYFKNVHVTVLLNGLRFSVLGEVAQQGKHTLFQRQVTILEAIAHSGGLRVVADRKRIQLVRQYEDGPRIHEVDLTSDDLLHSPYYLLHHNDVVYVRPLRVREYGIGIEGFPTFLSVLTAITSTLLLINLLSD